MKSTWAGAAEENKTEMKTPKKEVFISATIKIRPL